MNIGFQIIRRIIFFIIFIFVFISCKEERTEKSHSNDKPSIAKQSVSKKSQSILKDVNYIGPANWSMFMYDISYRGISPDKKLKPPLSLAWKYKTGGPVDSGPVVVNGTVYVGSDDNRLYALNADKWGQKWDFDSGDRISYSPTVYKGVVFFSTRGNKVFALDAQTGTKRWEFQSDGWINAPVVAYEDRIYVGAYSNKIYVLDATTGKKVGESRSRINIGNIPYACIRGEFYPIDVHERSAKWRNLFPSSESWPATANGFVYIGSRDKKIYAFDKNTHRQVWAYETDGWVDSSPAIANGMLYIGSRDGYVYAFKNSDKVKPELNISPKGVVTQDRVKIYTQPGISSETLMEKLNEGMELPILEKRQDWIKVGLPNGQTGWLRSLDFVEIESFEELQLNKSFINDVKHLIFPKGAAIISCRRIVQRWHFLINISTRSVYWLAESIWVADSYGRDPKWISDGAFYNPSISWSGDSKRFAFENLARTERQIWIVDSDGLGLKKIAIGESPAMSPKGNLIAFIRRDKNKTSIWVKNLTSGAERKIAEFVMKGEEAYIVYGYTASFTTPAWSSDGLYLAIGLDGYHYQDNNSRLAIVKSNGGLVKEIAVRAWRIRNALWSPDNNFIAFVTQEHSSRQFGRYLDKKVHIVNIDGQSINTVFEHSEGLSWSPDGKYLAFIEENDCMGIKRKVWLYNVKNKERVQLLASKETIDKIHWLTEDKIAILASTDSLKSTYKTVGWIISNKILN